MLLLDTCALLWLSDDQGKLSQVARQLIVRHAGSLFVSAASGFEIARKQSQGKLDLPLPAEEWYPQAIASHGLAEIPLTGEILIRAAHLPMIHRDPCDRFILATALLKDMTLVTADTVMPQYPGVKVVW